MNKKIQIIVNLMIPLSAILAFILLGLLDVLIKSKLKISLHTQELGVLAKSLEGMNALYLACLIGLTCSIALSLAWVTMIVKGRAEKYIISINKAVLSVLAIWLSATIILPFVLFLIYKPVFR